MNSKGIHFAIWMSKVSKKRGDSANYLLKEDFNAGKTMFHTAVMTAPSTNQHNLSIFSVLPLHTASLDFRSNSQDMTEVLFPL